MAGPFVVVVASLASVWLAIKSDDGVVAPDYYKQGLLINERLKLAPPNAERRLGATVRVAAGGEVRVRMHGLVDAPQSLRLRLAHPSTATREAIVVLKPDADGDYIGALPDQMPGRWIVTLESDAWRLPTTVAGSLSEIRLGAAERS